MDGQIYSFDVRKGAITADSIGSPVTSLDLTLDARCLLIGTADSELCLFEISSGLALIDYTGPVFSEHYIQAKFTADNKHVVSGSENTNCYIFDTSEVV